MLVSTKTKRLLRLAALSLLFVGAADPRPELIDLQLEGEFEATLLAIEQIVASQPDAATLWGLEYLRGHLLDRLQRRSEATEAFSAAMTSTPLLTDYSRYRLAIDRFAANQPRMASSLLALLLVNRPSAALTDQAIALMNRAMSRGGECQALDRWETWELDRSQGRKLLASLIDCDQSQDASPISQQRWTVVLQSDRTDETARRAADRLASYPISSLDDTTSLLIGLTFFEHREFDRALPFLESSLQDLTNATRDIRDVKPDDVLYSIARSYYWRGDYPSAIEWFSRVAEQTDKPERSAQALFQHGRCFALMGDWNRAVEMYRSAAEVDPSGSWAAAALISAMRLEWRQGREESALRFFGRLRSQGRWRRSVERAAIFLAASDLVTHRGDRAGAWLDLARQAARGDRPEILYWRGRLAEIEHQNPVAVRNYAALMASNPYHPLSQAARVRLRETPLNQIAKELGEHYSRSSRTQDLLRAQLLLDVSHPGHQSSTLALMERWSRNSSTRLLLEGKVPPAGEWPLWKLPVREPEDLLLTLGIIEVYAEAVRRSFPLANTGLALNGSRLMAISGLHRRSLYYAEVVGQRLPNGLPQSLLADSFRRLLYPKAYDFLIEQQARRFGVDSHLLRALIREESRFDPMAVSAASARGLTQFVLPTARRLGLKLGLLELDAWDLHEPEIAITLGAAYLAELEKRFDGHTLQEIAAYNAGENLARLWQSYCFSSEPEEYFSKIGFRQTRGYLEKVLSSRGQYREIYAEGLDAYPASHSRTSTTGGSDW